LKKINIHYWSPHINSNVATVKAVLNSTKSLKKYSYNYDVNIINVFGEWDFCKESNKEINFIDLYLSKKLNINKNITGFIKSRLSYLLIGLFSIIPLYKLLKKDKPDYLVVHLLTFIPFILLILFNFKTKFILRISGYPKMSLLRKILWKKVSKKIFKVFCPTNETIELLSKLNIFEKNKFYLLEDPIIEISKIKKKSNEKIVDFLINKKFILAIGRLSIQKNFQLLLNFFKKETIKDPDLYLIIAGEGEIKNRFDRFLTQNKLENKIIFLGYQDNIHNLLKKCLCFISTSLWEDPGFALVEAAANNTSIISSDCPSGPKEILKNGKGGILFYSNNLLSLEEGYKKFKKLNEKDIYLQKVYSKKTAINYTKFRHYKKLNYFLNANKYEHENQKKYILKKTTY
jgi:glycosyltransferase involved in cell wall biosynthesis